MATKESRQDTTAAVAVEQIWSTAERMFWASNGMCTHQNVGRYALLHHWTESQILNVSHQQVTMCAASKIRCILGLIPKIATGKSWVLNFCCG
jgi:hypothetical protein